MRKIIYGLVFVVLVFSIFSVYQYIKFNDGKLHVIFCDVGQGDSILIKTPKNNLILIDGGRDSSVLGCLSNNTAYWMKEIDLVMLSHKHSDHFSGLIHVFNSYKVLGFATTELRSSSENYTDLKEKIEDEKARLSSIYQYDVITTEDGVRLTVLGPNRELIERLSNKASLSSEEANTSLVILLEYGGGKILFTGDNTHELLDLALENKNFDIDIMQVPHHGSKTGLNQNILERLEPEVAVISVGKNSYGHPHESIIDILNKNRVAVFRTDRSSDIEFIFEPYDLRFISSNIR